MSKSAKKRLSSTTPVLARRRTITRGNAEDCESRSRLKTISRHRDAAVTDGATIASMMKATSWQQHSVRGFLAGVVRKRLKLKLDSKKVDGTRVYQIASGRSGKSSARQSKRRSILIAMPRVRIGPAIPDRKTLDAEIARLRDLDVGALRARWHTVGFVKGLY